uniref:Uncharacterized protein n=1 Tax=Rhizophora mucronata TaxID=61149 RepID=A0A2P2JAX1_RHIMU
MHNIPGIGFGQGMIIVIVKIPSLHRDVWILGEIEVTRRMGWFWTYSQNN